MLWNVTPDWCFEPPGRKSALLGPKVDFSRQSALLAPRAPFSEKVHFGAKRWFRVIRVEKGPIPSGNSYGFVNSGDFGVSVMQKSEFHENSLISCYFYETNKFSCHFMIFAPCHENHPRILPQLLWFLAYSMTICKSSKMAIEINIWMKPMLLSLTSCHFHQNHMF